MNQEFNFIIKKEKKIRLEYLLTLLMHLLRVNQDQQHKHTSLN
jgi:hypothetical protein